MVVAEVILMVAGAYAGLGVLFSLAFVTRGVGVVDRAARGAPVGFRVLITPGVVALWPLLARRWLAARHVADTKEAHA
jgi:hypothetical protein